MVQLTTSGATADAPRALKVVGRKSDALSDVERGHVTYEVYLPFDPEHPGIDQIDTHGELMLLEDLRALAGDFLVNSRVVSVQHYKHGGAAVNVPVIESFVNDERFQSPHVYPGAWVVTLDYSGAPELHEKVKAGEFKSVSWTAMVYEQPVLIPEDLVADDPYEGLYDKTLSAKSSATDDAGPAPVAEAA